MKKTIFYEAAELVAKRVKMVNGMDITNSFGVWSCCLISALGMGHRKGYYDPSHPQRKWYIDAMLKGNPNNCFENDDQRIIALLLADIIWREEH